MYNILNIYSKWVSQRRASSVERLDRGRPDFEQPSNSADRYRKSIVKKVARDIVSKITNLESNNKRSQKIAEKLKGYEVKNGNANGNNGDTFVYNRIEKGNKKTTNTLIIDKSSFLAK